MGMGIEHCHYTRFPQVVGVVVMFQSETVVFIYPFSNKAPLPSHQGINPTPCIFLK